MHPMFVALYIEMDPDDLLAKEQDRKRRAHAARRFRQAEGRRHLRSLGLGGLR